MAEERVFPLSGPPISEDMHKLFSPWAASLGEVEGIVVMPDGQFISVRFVSDTGAETYVRFIPFVEVEKKS